MTESEKTESERRITVRPTMALANRNRPRGMWGQITTTLLRPGLFYKTLLPASETRQWLWAAILILVLVGVSTVRYSALRGASGTDTVVTPPDMGGDFGGEFGGDFGGGMMGGDFGGMPPGGMVETPGGTPAATSSTLTADLTTALLASSNIVLGWIVLTAMLVVVPMLRGRAPRVGQNLQIAIWSSLPFAVMAVLQLVYYASGGQIGEPGVQGLLKDIPGYGDLSSTTQALLISFTSRLTVFWLWSMLLVYFGARYALGGWRIVALLIVIAWGLIQIAAPVITEAITVPVTEEVLDDGGMMGGDFGEFPPDMGMDGGMDVPTDEFSPEGEDDTTGASAIPEGEVTPEAEATPETTDLTVTPED